MTRFGHTLSGERSSRTRIKLAKPLKVRVTGVSLAERKIDFELSDSLVELTAECERLSLALFKMSKKSFHVWGLHSVKALLAFNPHLALEVGLRDSHDSRILG